METLILVDSPCPMPVMRWTWVSFMGMTMRPADGFRFHAFVLGGLRHLGGDRSGHREFHLRLGHLFISISPSAWCLGRGKNKSHHLACL
jgi:hypothetical protein